MSSIWGEKVMKPEFYQVQAVENVALCLKVRRAVFIEDQGIPENIEVDGQDKQCVHFLGELGGAPIATLRIQKQGPKAKIQRVAVLEQYRSTGAGRAIMEEAIAWCRDWGYKEVVLGAQVTVIGFYEKFGFTVYGEAYVEADIEHRDMKLVL